MPVTERSPVVRLEGVVALLGPFPALSGLNLELSKGDVLSVTGPNGAGKSTLLKVVAGLVPISSGTGSVLGTDISPGSCTARVLRSLRSRVGYLGHETGLFGDLTAKENVELFAKAAGAGVDGVDAALSAVGLTVRERGVRAGSMSAGQRKRTSIAALLARRTSLWLLDEPHAGLDPAARDILDATVCAAADTGVSIVIASHDVDRVNALSSRFAEVAGGTVVCEGMNGRSQPPEGSVRSVESQGEPQVEPVSESHRVGAGNVA